MNLIDRTVAYFDPMSGVRRVQARMALDQARAYEAAKLSRDTRNWKAGSGSANAELAPSLTRVRNRMRQLVRDNPYAARGLEGLVSMTVGTGIAGIAPDQNMWNRWTQYCDAEQQLDFAGLTELAHRTRRESGAVIVRFRDRGPDSGLEVPVQIQVMEPDHLDVNKTGPIAGSNNFCICGVEFNPIGQRVAYWLFPIHPGEIASWRLASFASKRVPASEVLHYYRKRRPSQVDGLPEFATSLLRLRNLDDYQLAELVRKKIEACFVAFVKTDDPNQQLGDTAGQNQGPPRDELMRPGMIKYLPNSDSVSFGSPSSSGGYGDFTMAELRAIAAGGGTTYELMTGDHSQQNYSGGRLQRLALQPLIEQEQWLALAPMFLNPIAARFQATAKLAGKQRGAVEVFNWTMPRIPMQDLLKEALGIKEMIRGGLISLPEAIRELGYDPKKLLDENAAYRKDCIAAGVAVDTDPLVALKLVSPETAANLFGTLIKD